MVLDQEAIKKRFSQLELDINNMNRMIDDNLQIGETEEEIGTEEAGVSPAGAVEDLDGSAGGETSKSFSQMTGEAAQDFIRQAGTPDADAGEVLEAPKESIQVAPPLPDVETPEREAESTNVEKVTEISKQEVLEVAEPAARIEKREKISIIEARNEEPERAEHEQEHEPEIRAGAAAGGLRADVTDHAIDQATDTSEDFTVGNVTTAISSNSSFSSPAEPAAPIFLPKNTSQNTALRRPTNPFRVISVGAAHSETTGHRKTSGDTPAEPRAPEADGPLKLQKRLDYLTKKCLKLRKEIQYLNDMNYQNTLSIEDGRRLSSAIEKLQEYLDTKNKERYDLGILVSRQLRRDIDRGENGQFWIGTK